GPNIGPSSLVLGALDRSGRLATAAGGTRVLFDNVAAPIVYTSQNQISAVVPSSLAGKTSTTARVELNGAAVGSVPVAADATAPALFTANSSGKGQVAALNQDGSVNGPSNPAPSGSVVVLYATGAGVLERPLADGEIAGSALISAKAPVFVRFGKLPGQI